jgi:hypothetical protein
MQDFLKVFEQLRDEIVNDELLNGQPESSMKWVKEVRTPSWDAGWYHIRPIALLTAIVLGLPTAAQ